MRAPAITKPMVVSANLILNIWQAMITIIHNIIFGSNTDGIMFRQYANYEDDQGDRYAVDAMLFHKEGYDVCVEASTSSTSTMKFKINDNVVHSYHNEPAHNGYTRFYIRVPETIPNREHYFFKAGPFDDLPNESRIDYYISSPFEVPSLDIARSGPSTQLNDFLTGTPTVEEWNEVSEALNSLNPLEFRNVQSLELAYDIQNDVFDADNPEHISARYRIQHGFSNLHVRLGYTWPSPLNEERIVYYVNMTVNVYNPDGSLKYTWRDSVTQARGTGTWPAGTTTQDVKVQSKAYFAVNDNVQILTRLSGIKTFKVMAVFTDPTEGQMMSLQLNNTEGGDVEVEIGRPINLVADTTYDDDTIAIYPSGGNDNDVQLLFPVEDLTLGDTYDIIVQWNYHRNSGSTLDPYGENGTVFYVGEIVNPAFDDNDLLPMTPFEDCDSIPGHYDTQPEKTIHRIIENIRKVTGGSTESSSMGSEKMVLDYSRLVGVHKYDYLAYKATRDCSVHYWNGTEWLSATLATTGDDVRYVRLSTNAPGIVVGNFMYIANAEYACEVDYAQGASIKPGPPSIQPVEE